MGDFDPERTPPPILNSKHDQNGAYHIAPEIDFGHGINGTYHIHPEDIEQENLEKAHQQLCEKYPFLLDAPMETVQTWVEQWRNASATEGGRSMSMWEFISIWAEQDGNDVVPGVLPRGEVVVIAAESGGGKSYLGAEMFTTCLTGGKWWGRYDAPKLTPLYCLIEDQKGWSKRLQSHLNATDWKPGDTIGYVRNDLPRLLESGNFNRNAAGGYEWYLRIRADQYRGTLPEKLDVLFIDYLRDAAPGADEQSNNDMSLVMDGVNQLARALDLLLVLMHHRGANTDKATRGATVVVDKSYAVFVLTGKLIVDDKNAKVKMEAAKSPKGIARPAPIYFRLNGESGNLPILEYAAGDDTDLADDLYTLLRAHPGKRLSVTQLQNEIDRPDGTSAEAWKQRLLRAGRALQGNIVKYPGVDYEAGRGGGYAFIV